MVESTIHSIDTHGFTEVNFALTAFLGIEFAPRLQSFQDQQLYAAAGTGGGRTGRCLLCRRGPPHTQHALDPRLDGKRRAAAAAYHERVNLNTDLNAYGPTLVHVQESQWIKPRARASCTSSC